MLVLTVSTGMVDAVSILSLGRVFVANMTGNIVFIGFALAGAPGFSLQASLVALAAFLVGAALGGVLVGRLGRHRGVLLRNDVALEFVALAAGVVVLAMASAPYRTLPQDLAVGCAGVALGLQNAAARRLAVPDLTTTVLTMTLTGIAADVRNRDFAVVARRLLAVGTMLLGAVAGALLTRQASPAIALAVACGLVLVVATGATAAVRRPGAWQTAA